MSVKLIKTRLDYLNAIQAIKSLILLNPASGSIERDQIEALSLSIERYEGKNYKFEWDRYRDENYNGK